MQSSYMTETGRHKACTQCREKKIKCNGLQPKCRRFLRYGHQCHYAPTAKRCSKADFATMLEAMNRRLLQAEATSAAASQNADYSLDLSSSLAMPPMWSPFTASSQAPGIPKMSSDFSFATGHAQFTNCDEATVTDMNTATVGNEGETMQTQTTDSSTMPEPHFDFSTTLNFTFNDGTSPFSFQPTPIHSNSKDLVPVSDDPPQLQLERNGTSSLPEKRRRVDPEPSNVWSSDEEISESVGRRKSPVDSSDPSHVLSPCNSTERRKIGNGASFQGIPVLQGPENYDSWFRAMRAAARKGGRLGHADGGLREAERATARRISRGPATV
ncbi:hypothetical protein PG993_011379 [Apiospora rasikravindrae]|uniref:Zn(2)-C6 fungal-type domain-containing protein n=1 Tax=Apiospora rasikravindrae TaxID=990691 RepID=A0ABR1SFQ6_9PEZI